MHVYLYTMLLPMIFHVAITNILYLIFPKDKDEMKEQSNIIYWYRCGRTECDDEYIGESARTFEERFKEHLKAPSIL